MSLYDSQEVIHYDSRVNHSKSHLIRFTRESELYLLIF